MPIDRSHLGRRYGPYRFTVGVEHLRDFVAATGMGVPGRVLRSPPPAPHPWTWDEQAAAASPHGGARRAAVLRRDLRHRALRAACADPALGIDLVRLVHGEQAFELARRRSAPATS